MTGNEYQARAREFDIRQNIHLKDRVAVLEQALKEIRASARFEQETPTGLHMTCLSIIENTANKALGETD